MTREQNINKQIENIMNKFDDSEVIEKTRGEEVEELVSEAIEKNPNKIMSVSFRKKNGDIRNMTFRIGVSKGVKGTGNPETLKKYKETLKKNKMLGVFEMLPGKNPEDCFRTVNLNTVTRLKMSGVTYTWEDE